MIKEISLSTNKRNELIDISSEVDDIVSGVKDGVCVVYCPHTTAAVTINESADPDVQTDIIGHLNKMVPEGHGFKHAEGNSDAHIKSSLIGCSETLMIEDGKLRLGRWQAVYFAEFDGPRQRKVVVRVMEG
ncbi:YjbQ family protein [Candidatus Woesearchaeota archaeon]|nr:YjbQ family protein [Candidatus Woesearchaeota archaeon]